MAKQPARAPHDPAPDFPPLVYVMKSESGMIQIQCYFQVELVTGFIGYSARFRRGHHGSMNRISPCVTWMPIRGDAYAWAFSRLHHIIFLRTTLLRGALQRTRSEDWLAHLYTLFRSPMAIMTMRWR